MVTQVDHEVGRLLDSLEQLGVAERTVVIFTSDHGDMQGSHGLKNKSLPYEESAGIPLIVRVPDRVSGVVSSALISGVDYLPTCLAYAGVAVPGGLPGTSFAPLTLGREQDLHGPLFSEMRDWVMVRKNEWKLVLDRDADKPTMLFNLSEDPYEENNLVHDIRHTETQSDLLQDIYAWQAMCQSAFC
jgi:choline-sulfatase